MVTIFGLLGPKIVTFWLAEVALFEPKIACHTLSDWLKLLCLNQRLLVTLSLTGWNGSVWTKDCLSHSLWLAEAALPEPKVACHTLSDWLKLLWTVGPGRSCSAQLDGKMYNVQDNTINSPQRWPQAEELRMYLWWSWCTFYLHASQVRVTVGDSGLCCSVCVMSFECWLTPLAVDFKLGVDF